MQHLTRLVRLSGLTLLMVGAACGSQIYQCSFNGLGFTAAGCYSTTAFITTNDFVDWGNQNGVVNTGVGSGFGSFINNSFNVGTNDQTRWTTNTATGAVQVGVGIMPSNFSGTPQFQRVDNLGYAQRSNGTYTLSNNVPGLNSFSGHFDGTPDPTSQYINQTDYTSVSVNGVPLSGFQGDHLIRMSGSNSGILITFSQPVSAVGFRASAINDTQPGGFQDLSIRAYNVFNPINSTQPYLSYELQDSNGFGTCATDSTLSGGPPSHPTPCNDAPFIGIDSSSALFTSAPLVQLPNSPWIRSIFISSTDNVGFLIDELFIQDSSQVEVPEPVGITLVGAGLLLIAVKARARRV